jgi:hypothetical protein
MKQTKQTRRKTMKMVTKIAVLASFATIMFAGVSINWGHSYADDGAGTLGAKPEFGVTFDINDATSIGWSDENGMLVGLDGPMDMTMRLGFAGGTSLGVSRAWWSSTGAGWGTSLNTTVDFQLTDVAGNNTSAGDFKIGVNLGFGF